MMIRIDDMEPKTWEAMCLPINLVLPADEQSNRGALYIGTWVASMDSEILDAHHIDDIVSINDEAMMTFNRTDGRGALRIVLSDSTSSNIRPHLDDACKYIASKLSQGENVLVHCQQGISRSASIVIAFLMRERRLSYDVALNFLREKRKCIKPNSGFEHALRGWGAAIAKFNDPLARPKLERVRWSQRQLSNGH